MNKDKVNIAEQGQTWINAGQEQSQTWIDKKEPIVYFCCCGCSLRTGCLLIGLLNMVFAVINLVGLPIGMYYMVYSDDLIGALLMASFSIRLVISALEGTSDVILLIGIYNVKPEYLYVYVIFSVCKISIEVLSFILMVLTPIIIPCLLIEIGLHIYFALVVESYRRMLLKEQNNRTCNEYLDVDLTFVS